MPRGDPTKVERVGVTDAKKIQEIADDRGLTFAQALRALAGKNIARAHRRMKQRKQHELGVSNAG